MSEKPIKQQFIETFQSIAYRHSAWTVWSDFVLVAACTISNIFDKQHYADREAQYRNTIKKYQPDEQEKLSTLLALTTLALEENSSQDFLGQISEKLGLTNPIMGQFYTPYHIGRLMSDLMISDDIKMIKEKGVISVMDCCCGAGSLLIAFANSLYKKKINYQQHVFFIGQDISPTAALACYIQLSLLGCAGFVVIGNSLTHPAGTLGTEQDTWHTPMYYHKTWRERRLWHFIDALIRSEPNKKERKND